MIDNGDDGRDLERDDDRCRGGVGCELDGGERGRVDIMGAGAWIWIDIASVGFAR